jgi:predicted dithiol-disulfide oxidoreductase (DUF899 family)
MALRAQVEQVAALRRTLPLGGELSQDYAFTEWVDGQERTIAFSELFGPKHDTLVLYNFMYSPDMAKPCSMCTSILDSLDGSAAHVAQRVSLVIVGASPIARLREFAQSRSWRNLRLVSSHGTRWQHDYLAENDESYPWPMANTFVRRQGQIHHWWGSELFYSPDDNMDTRHVDALWPLWNVLDLTPDGRGATWYPALDYPE